MQDRIINITNDPKFRINRRNEKLPFEGIAQ